MFVNKLSDCNWLRIGREGEEVKRISARSSLAERGEERGERAIQFHTFLQGESHGAHCWTLYHSDTLQHTVLVQFCSTNN